MASVRASPCSVARSHQDYHRQETTPSICGVLGKCGVTAHWCIAIATILHTIVSLTEWFNQFYENNNTMTTTSQSAERNVEIDSVDKQIIQRVKQSYEPYSVQVLIKQFD